MIPPTIGITIDAGAEGQWARCRRRMRSDPKVKEIIDAALRLEGLIRGAGVHAAGVVIAPKPLTELVPVTRAKNEDIVTSYDMGAIEKMGLLKMDFLGLTTLTVIDDCLKLIKRTTGETEMSIWRRSRSTTRRRMSRSTIGRLPRGCSSLNRVECATCLRRYKPNSVEDLTALNALYRPGPIQGGMIDDFIERKWGRRR